MIGDGTKISTATDVHGLGMILWEMKTAEKPYDNLSLEAICQHKGQGGQLPLPSDILDEVKELIRRCWNQEPSQRHRIYIRTVKFRFSEKATNFEKNLPLVLTLLGKNSCFIKTDGSFFLFF